MEIHTPVEYTQILNTFLISLKSSLAFKCIYSSHKSVVAKLITLHTIIKHTVLYFVKIKNIEMFKIKVVLMRYFVISSFKMSSI